MVSFQRCIRVPGLLLAAALWFNALPALAALDTSEEDFVRLEERYRELRTRQKEQHQVLLRRILEAHKSRAAESEAQETAAGNRQGAAVAREAVELIDKALADLERYREIKLPARVRRELEDFFETITLQKKHAEDRFEQQTAQLKNHYLNRFTDEIEMRGLDMSPEEIKAAFDEWLEPLEQELVFIPDEQESPAAETRLSAADIGLDIYAAGFEALKKELREHRQRADSSRKRLLERMLEPHKEAAQERLAEARRTRNVRAMAVENRAVELLRETAEEIEEEGRMSLPEDVRPELREFIDSLAREKAAIEERISERWKQVEEEIFNSFRELALAQPDAEIDADETLTPIFQAWLRDEDLGPRLAGNDRETEGTTPADRLYFAQTGDGKEWFTVGRWAADTPGTDIFEIPIYQGESRSGTQFNRMFRAESKWQYQHETGLQRGQPYAFRLRRIRNMEPVTVLEWPAQRGDWNLVVRTGRQAGEYGFELQAAVREIDPSERMVEVPVVTDPEGARVYVDGEFYFEPGGDSRTPLVLRVPQGRREITLEHDGYLSKRVSDIAIRPGAQIRHRFQHPSQLPGKTVNVTPRESWVRSSVEVETGDRLWLVPSGRWRIGSRGEMTGPEGYSRQEFPHYYEEELRKTGKAPYGALLFKFAEEYYGAPADVEDRRALPLTETVSMRAPTWGPLWFDVNEKEDTALRRLSSGSLTVKVIVIPQGEDMPMDTRQPGFNSF